MKGRFVRRMGVEEETMFNSSSRQIQSPSAGRLAAFASPRTLLAAMALVLTGGSLWALAQKPSATPTSATSPPVAAGQVSKQVLTWDKLPQMVAAVGQRRAAQRLAQGSSAGGGIAPMRFSLTEVDLTPGNLSDEREPAYRPPTSDYIAFSSNGVDADNNGRFDATTFSFNRKYHIWIMRRDGSGLRQVTGFGADRARDQRTPTWSPDGTRLCYSDVFTTATSQLFVVNNVVAADRPLPVQITFFSGQKLDPAWSPNGTSIAFASNVALGANNTGTTLNNFDIFTIAPSGSTLSVRRLTGDPDDRASGAGTPGDPQDVLGNTTNDRSPSYSQVNPGVLFFSSNRETFTTGTGQTATTSQRRLAAGRRIWAMNGFNGSFKRQITNPVARGGSAADEDDNPSSSRAVAGAFPERLAFDTNSRINTADVTRDLNVWSLAVNSSTLLNNANGTALPVEGLPSVAEVESNLFSSPTAIQNSFVGAQEDRAADREPTYSRSNGSRALASPLAFASTRQRASSPSANGQNPAPVVINPGGGNTTAATHDIWTTLSADASPPLLVPVAAGNQQFPLVAPGRQAPFFAPRTAEEGLNPGGKLIVAAVISERESGLSTTTADAAVQVSIRRLDTAAGAGASNFLAFQTRPNENQLVTHLVEQQAPVVASGLVLSVFDNGPPSRGGNERQANAIKGDGIYYAQGSFDALDAGGQPLEGDFALDLTATDRDGNSLTYDHIYGFSTEPFRKQANLLFVSDYTHGQQFPALLFEEGIANRRSDPGVTGFLGGGLPPVESYHLLNPGGRVALDADATPPTFLPSTDQSLPYGTAADQTTFSPPGSFSFGSAPTSVDVWRIISRGEVSEDVIRLYSPQATTQIDPAAFPLNAATVPAPTPIPEPGSTPQPDPTRPVTVAENAIVWAAPYSGVVLAAPGTIFDTETQRRLTNYLNSGGRLFLNGQDILFALSNAGTTSNPFLRDELKADWGRETGAADELIPNFGFDIRGNGDDGEVANRSLRFARADRLVQDPPLNLHVPYNPAGDNDENSYWDAADNDSFPDTITPQAAANGDNVTAMYTYGDGGRAGQRVIRARANGLESRVVFFGFGLEMINREYTANEDFRFSRNYRARLADNVANWLRTGRITGQVINAATNQPIPNFLIQVTDEGFQQRFFLVRTDANGNYEIPGVPARDEFYRVSPASFRPNDGVTRSLNPGYFTNQNILTQITVLGGQTRSGVNFRINPTPPSTVRGRAISDRGTATNVTDDSVPDVEVAPNLPVLLRSIDRTIPPSANFPLGGTYAQLTQTDATGEFIFSNVPSDLRVEIIFNPRPGFVSQGGDIPDGSGINYNTPTSEIRRNPNFGRRVIPIDTTYSGPRPAGVPDGTFIIVPQGGRLELGDIPVPQGASSLTGRVFLNGAPSPATRVELLSGTTVLQTTTTNPQGIYIFDNVTQGTYTVRATRVTAGVTFTGQVAVGVPARRPDGSSADVNAPNINLVRGVTPTPTPRPGTTPTPAPTTVPGSEQYRVGQTYMISIPYANSTVATAVTTVAKAFTVPQMEGTTTNFRLFRYDATRNQYVPLSASSLVRRGEGYFLRPIARGVDLRRPPAARDLFPTPVAEFTITLRRNTSATTDPNNGFNLIGFPFDPARYGSINWLDSRVIGPDGRVYANLNQAVAAGLISPTLFTLPVEGGATYLNTQIIEPFRGYYARTFVDNVRVVLRARLR
jgi:hypothetical protein